MSDERAQPAAGDAGQDSGASGESPPTQGSAAGQDNPGRQDSTGGAWELPWGEPFATNAATAERARLATAFGAATRRTGSLMQLMGQAAADRIGINATDLNCLNILSFSGHMTAGELAKATGLTT